MSEVYYKVKELEQALHNLSLFLKGSAQYLGSFGFTKILENIKSKVIKDREFYNIENIDRLCKSLIYWRELREMIVNKRFPNIKAFENKGFLKDRIQILKFDDEELIQIYNSLLPEKTDEMHVEFFIKEIVIKYIDIVTNDKKVQVLIKDLNVSKERNNPTIKPDYIGDILKVLGPYFPTQQKDFEDLLNDPSKMGEPLCFFENGNKLLHSFYELHKAQIILYNENKHFKEWVIKRFKFWNKKKGDYQEFKDQYILQHITGGIEPADGKKLLKVENGKIIPLEIIKRKKS
jgi:hypothetical protein